jgi:hypothetical protein
VVWFRTLDDYRHVREKATGGARFVVIGGGFIGSELAAALVGAGVRVTMVFPEPGIGSRLFPAGLAEFLADYYREKGVEVLSGQTVGAASATSVTLGDGRVLEADCVVAGLGVVPETDLAEAAGLEVEDGIVVDEYGRASGRDDANMAGASQPYDHLPLFYSDLFDLGYEAVGLVDSRLETVEEWQEPYRKGVVTYVEDGRPRGVLLWNVWDRGDDARELIRSGEGTFAV